MLKVSQEWSDSIKQEFRNAGLLELTLNVSDVNPSISYAEYNLKPDDKEVYKLKTSTELYASLEPGRWLLNGSAAVLEKDEHSNIWFRVNEVGIYDVVFDKDVSFEEVYIEWDAASTSYPTTFTIDGGTYGTGSFPYSYVCNGSTPKEHYKVPMDSVSYVRIIIPLDSWSEPEWRPRLSFIHFGYMRIYGAMEGKDILSATTISGCDPMSSKLPTHTLEVSIDNLEHTLNPLDPFNDYNRMKAGTPAFIQWGYYVNANRLEWAPPVHYYLESFTAPLNTTEAKLKFTSGLALEKVSVPSFYDAYWKPSLDRTLLEISEGLLKQYYGVESVSDTPWVLDARLAQVSSKAFWPSLPLNQSMQYVANAAMCVMYTRLEDGKTVISPRVVESAKTQLGSSTITQEPEITLDKDIKSITVNVYEYRSEGKAQIVGSTLVEFSGINGGAEFRVDFDQPCDYSSDTTSYKFISSVANNLRMDIFSMNYTYVTGYVSYIGTAMGALSFTLEISAEPAKALKVKDPVVLTLGASGQDIVVDNPFITSRSHAEEVLNWVKKSLSRNTHYKVPYVGYPEVQAGDLVELDTKYDHNSDGVVAKNTIQFNGGFSGTMEVV